MAKCFNHDLLYTETIRYAILWIGVLRRNLMQALQVVTPIYTNFPKTSILLHYLPQIFWLN
jgi:hypothetical protein